MFVLTRFSGSNVGHSLVPEKHGGVYWVLLLHL